MNSDHDRQCRHFDMTFKNGERMLVCLGCQKFWPMPAKVLGFQETLRQWVQERGSFLLAAMVISMSLSLLAVTVAVITSPEFPFIYSTLGGRRPR